MATTNTCLRKHRIEASSIPIGLRTLGLSGGQANPASLHEIGKLPVLPQLSVGGQPLTGLRARV